MSTEQRSPRDVAAAMAQAAIEWIATLDDVQRADGVWHWPGSPAADHERVRWYYTPTDHGGLTLHRMTPHQQRAAMRLLATGLSEAGYVTATTIMGLENVLDRTENFSAGFARDRGRDPGMYYLRIFGDPENGQPWAWRYGGHHVSVNHLVVDREVAAGTPCFLGADPAVSPLLGGRELRPLGGVEDIARELLHSLDSQQRARATLSTTAPADIVSGNRIRLSGGDRLIPLPDLWRGHFDDQPLEDRLWSMHHDLEAHLGVTESDHRAVELTEAPKGVAARDLTPNQRKHLRDLLEVYIGRMPPGLVERERSRFDGDQLDEVHFAWAGGAERGEPHYYRLQGPRLLAEWDHTQRGVNHAHSVWRDPTGDFGLDVLAQHRATHHPPGASRREGG
ncbi:uncharacterized protein DUF3500 [Halopolyspora algeriensis]|uniref:Uncharacterized protein DUF3500 n=1 Tax=Halopolyspora algeriensis TaxID=1500506 RepID=A0A368VJR1_9ACTN|nr:DUF3500 domain-containing protein [Halopolyspora algeriensis]RCW41002.1 uncharacterized protein DUF3500 [Halopolyspora algeriensis]TQM53914.1 uncharacterized protein DUF3500 [Halopolyspora algeriensis]